MVTFYVKADSSNNSKRMATPFHFSLALIEADKLCDRGNVF